MRPNNTPNNTVWLERNRADTEHSDLATDGGPVRTGHTLSGTPMAIGRPLTPETLLAGRPPRGCLLGGSGLDSRTDDPETWYLLQHVTNLLYLHSSVAGN